MGYTPGPLGPMNVTQLFLLTCRLSKLRLPHRLSIVRIHSSYRWTNTICIVEAIGDADTPVTEVTVLQLRLALLKLRAPYPSLIAAARPLARPRSPPTQTAQPPLAQPQTAQPPFTLSQMAQPQQTIVQPQTAQQPTLNPETSGSAPPLLPRPPCCANPPS